jgi:hypothetical protein
MMRRRMRSISIMRKPKENWLNGLKMIGQRDTSGGHSSDSFINLEMIIITYSTSIKSK